MELLNLELGQLPPINTNAAIGLAIAVGALYCFLGYRTLRFIIGFTGFMLAGSFSGGLAAWITQGKVAWIVISAVAGGACGAAAMLFLYKVGVFSVGLLGGALVASLIFVDRDDPFMTSALIGLALFGGLGALILERPAMTLATAAIGAWVTVNGIYFLFLGYGSMEAFQKAIGQQRLILFMWTFLFLLGSIAQFASHENSAPSS
jgi:hypothetical protein